MVQKKVRPIYKSIHKMIKLLFHMAEELLSKQSVSIP